MSRRRLTSDQMTNAERMAKSNVGACAVPAQSRGTPVIRWGQRTLQHVLVIRHSGFVIHTGAMLDIRLIREKRDFVRERLATRGGGDEAKIDDVLRVDIERRKAETALQQLNADRKRLSKEIGGKKSQGESTEDLAQRVRQIGEQITELNAQAT